MGRLMIMILELGNLFLVWTFINYILHSIIPAYKKLMEDHLRSFQFSLFHCYTKDYFVVSLIQEVAKVEIKKCVPNNRYIRV